MQCFYGGEKYSKKMLYVAWNDVVKAKIVVLVQIYVE